MDQCVKRTVLAVKREDGYLYCKRHRAEENDKVRRERQKRRQRAS